MRMLFDCAVENELLTKNPVTKSVKCTSGKKAKEMQALTIDEQKLFLKTIKGTSTYNQFALLLQTGLRTGEPKTKNSIRDVPLTQEAIDILNNQKEKLKSMMIKSIEFPDNVFLRKDGMPIKNSAYDSKLFYHCDKAGIERFSMHVLRHTFATRCIESGMRPKTLQMILGHSNIGITMNLYVHVTDDEKAKEVQSIEKMLKII